MRRENLLARLFRALTGKSQKELGSSSGIHPVLLAQYEMGNHVPSPDHLRRLAREAGLTVAAGEEILRFAELLRQLQRRQREEAKDLFDDLTIELRSLVARVDQHLSRLPLPESLPRAEDRQLAGEQWLLLERLAEDEQLAVVRVAREYQTWALVERVCDESERAASQDLSRAASLARLAQEIADRVSGPEGWRNRVRGLAAAQAPNIQRVAGKLKPARAGLEEAKRLWHAGSDPGNVLDPSRLLDLEASLCRDERRFEEALALLDKAAAVSHSPGRVLIKKGFTLEVMGEYERAIETLLQAKPEVERQGDPRLLYMLRFNLAVSYCDIGRYGDAIELVQQVRELATGRGDMNEILRVTWLEGRIAAGLGRPEEALQLLEQARQEFAAREMWYDAALALLEVAALLLDEGRRAEVRALTPALAKVFASDGIHREALAALQLFREAVQREQATADFARSLLRFLFRARHDQGLRFTS